MRKKQFQIYSLPAQPPVQMFSPEDFRSYYKETKLSVIIPCFNAADTIGIQLEALASQRWSESWEVIVSDNGCTDNTIGIVNQYKGRFTNLRIVDASDKRGQAHARNKGAQCANGELFLFCDADDEVAPGWLAAMGEALSKYDFVACRIDIAKLNPAWIIKSRGHAQSDGLQTFRYPPYLPHAGGSTLGVRRWAHEAIGGFDESKTFLEDTDYCWKIQALGIKLHFVPHATAYVRLRHSIKGNYLQVRNYAEYSIKLYKEYRLLGMPKLSWKKSLESWKGLFISVLKNIFKIRDRGDIAYWAWIFGWRIGRLRGCIKYRVFPP